MNALRSWENRFLLHFLAQSRECCQGPALAGLVNWQPGVLEGQAYLTCFRRKAEEQCGSRKVALVGYPEGAANRGTAPRNARMRQREEGVESLSRIDLTGIKQM